MNLATKIVLLTSITGTFFLKSVTKKKPLKRDVKKMEEAREAKNTLSRRDSVIGDPELFNRDYNCDSLYINCCCGSCLIAILFGAFWCKQNLF